MKADWLCCEDGRWLQCLMAHRKPATKLPLTLTLLLDTFSGSTASPLVPFSLQSRALGLFASSNLGLQSQCRLSHVNCCCNEDWWPLCGACFHRPLCVCSSCWNWKFNVWFFPLPSGFLNIFLPFHPRNCEVFSSQEVHAVQSYPDAITINQC